MSIFWRVLAEGPWRRVLYAAVVVQPLVEMPEPLPDKARGIEGAFTTVLRSGGMFIQSEKFLKEHGGRIGASPFTARKAIIQYGGWRR
jgi:hypothetical protein